MVVLRIAGAFFAVLVAFQINRTVYYDVMGTVLRTTADESKDTTDDSHFPLSLLLLYVAREL